MTLFETISAVGILIAALSNMAFAFYLRRFVQNAIPLIRSINRSTKVLKTDLLLKRRELALRKIQGMQVREDIRAEDDFRT